MRYLHYELFILFNLNIQVMIPPFNPIIHWSPLGVHRQVIPHFINVIKKRRNALQWISNHHKSSFYVLIKIDQYSIALRIMRFHRDDLPSPAVIVPIVSGLEARQCLDEVPRHAGTAAGIRCRVRYLNVGSRFFGPRDFATAIWEGYGESAPYGSGGGFGRVRGE